MAHHLAGKTTLKTFLNRASGIPLFWLLSQVVSQEKYVRLLHKVSLT
jgi:hypothetical protein